MEWVVLVMAEPFGSWLNSGVRQRAVDSVHRPRLVGDRILGTREAVGVLERRNPDLVRRICEPVACDVSSHATLYDMDDASTRLASVARRYR